MRFPVPLKKGDNVFLVCPSSPVPFQEDIEKCCKAVTDLGLNPILGKSLSENYGGYMAGSPELRVADIHEAFSRKDVSGIFCVRGGYSASQLLNKLDYGLIRNNPKVFVGYSDVTNLHIVFNQKCNLGTYHGPMVKSNMIDDFNDYTKNSFLTALKCMSWEYEAPENMPISFLAGKKKKGQLSGILTGGNLAIIVTTLGTSHEIETKGKILFLEDVDEEIGSLDRMLTHLEYAGKLNDCAGIILGNFAACKNSYKTDGKEYEVKELFTDFFKDYEKPVIYGLESGHSKPFMATLPLGGRCSINMETAEIEFNKN